MVSRKHEYVSPSRGVLTTKGLSFVEEGHKYFYNGIPLIGITGKVGKALGKKFPEAFVEEGRSQGSHVHGAIEDFIKTGELTSVHPAVVWAARELDAVICNGNDLFAEVLISDFQKYATAVDVFAIRQGTKNVVLCDTKAGEFNREYVTYQLSIEKYFIESTTDFVVEKAFCISTRDREFYPIIFKSTAEVKRILYPS